MIRRFVFVFVVVVALLSLVVNVAFAAAGTPGRLMQQGQTATALILIVVAVLLGIIARTAVPFIQVLRDNPNTPFDRQFIIPAVMTLLIALLTSPLVFAALPRDQLNNPSPTFESLCLLFLAAWGTTDAIREGQKFILSRTAGQ